MSNQKYSIFLCTPICVHLFHWNERVIQGWPMLLLYFQHWHFNSVIEHYISGKLVCTVAYRLMTVINQPSSSKSVLGHYQWKSVYRQRAFVEHPWWACLTKILQLSLHQQGRTCCIYSLLVCYVRLNIPEGWHQTKMD